MSTPAHEEKILTLNLGGKKGVHILKRRYDVMKETILAVLSKAESMPTAKLSDTVKKKLEKTFDGKIGWYFMAVKLDLEARKIIERIPNKSPQMLRVK